MLFLINNPFLQSLSHLYVSLNRLFNQLLSLRTWECSFLLLYLGLVISPTSSLRFVNYKASYTIICHSDPFALRHFYTSLICPHLEYCFFLWDCQSSNLSSRLEKIQFLPVNYVLIVGPQTSLPFFLSFFFLRYLLTAAKLIFSFKLLHNNIDYTTNFPP